MNCLSKLSKRTNLLIWISATALALSIFAISCSSSRKQPAVVNPDPNRARIAEKKSRTNNVEQRILAEYRHWKGTYHRLGGIGKQGIDCSGFVKTVYKDAFDIDLPRTTKTQVRRGNYVPFKDLQPGDLVFFKPPDYPRHVGIFLSRSRFVHASKTRGVTISTIDANYWGKYYWTARRIIPVTKNQ